MEDINLFIFSSEFTFSNQFRILKCGNIIRFGLFDNWID